MICSFFKQGMCGKGAKCKFSHDLSKEVEPQKKNLYFDEREAGALPVVGSMGADTMADWDDATLADVVSKKHGAKDANKTTIVRRREEVHALQTCKHFLEAVESFKYGWFWNCPTGDACIYRHALPQGYILKRDKKKLDEQAKMEDKITIEELIEQEVRARLPLRCSPFFLGILNIRAVQRQKLGGNLTPVNPTTIAAWKKRKVAEARKTAHKVETKKMKMFKQVRARGPREYAHRANRRVSPARRCSRTTRRWRRPTTTVRRTPTARWTCAATSRRRTTRRRSARFTRSTTACSSRAWVSTTRVCRPSSCS